MALLILPALAFLHQAGRIAQATRERRLAALRLAGATPQDVRRLNAIEAARVSVIGAILGGTAFAVAERAALAATGVPLLTLRKVARRQAILATTPVCVVAALAGLIALAHPVARASGLIALWAAGRAVLMVALAVGAALLAVSATRPLLRRAASPTHLRTE
jgi:FtsX-like permease family protein